MGKFNQPQVKDILRINRLLPGAHYTDVTLRFDGQDLSFESDWLGEVLTSYLAHLKETPHQHKFTVDLGDPCFCGSDNCAACEVCLEEKHD